MQIFAVLTGVFPSYFFQLLWKNILNASVLLKSDAWSWQWNQIQFSKCIISSKMTYIAAVGHEGVPGGDTGVCVWAGAAAEVEKVCLLCLSSGVLGVWTVEEEVLELGEAEAVMGLGQEGRGCSVSLVYKGKRRIWAMSVTQRYSKPTVITCVCRDEFYSLGRTSA